MTLHARLSKIADRHERRRVKAAAFAALEKQVGRSVTRNGRTFTIASAPVAEGDALVLTVRVTRKGVDVTPPDLNPIRVHNPPVLVPDPKGKILRTIVSPTGETETLRFREDLPAALLAVIAEL